MHCFPESGPGDAAAAWSKVERHYSEPHRHYHDRQHLAHCLEQLDLAGGLILKPEQVEMAIWFHDIINQPGAADNEQRSAEYFRKLIGDRADPAFVNAVVQLIMATTHQSAPVEHDQQFICDIDLASFGCPWECFMRDSSAVKAEFTGTEEEYYRGKKAFLQQMLNRPRIFLTDFFNERYEQQARENIVRLLELVATRAD
jgi:predicted metal-dependent HD superfamily phosphohydrolase